MPEVDKSVKAGVGEARGSGKRLSVHWDYYDQIYESETPYGYDRMVALCRAAREAGVDSINFRVDGAGMAWVPCEGRSLFARVDPSVQLDWADFSRCPALKTPDAKRHKVAELFRQTYAICPDPLEAAASAAREAGLTLNIYVCPYDQFWPGVPDTLVEQYPHRCIVARDGKQRLAVPSLAYPENRAWLLAYYDHALNHDVADVILYSGSHAWYSYPIDTPDDWFGFEEPAVADYRAKTGIDARSQDVDVDDYYRHYGTYWTAFIKALSDRQKARGRRVVVGMDMGPWQVYLPWNAGRLMTTWRHENDWRTWTGWGNVDLCVGHQVNMWEYDMWPGNRLPCMPGEADKPPYRFAREIFGNWHEAGFRLDAFLTLHADRAARELPLAAAGVKSEGYDGLIVREAADFEFKLGWECLQGLLD